MSTTPRAEPRFLFIDSLRGIAAAWVAVGHFYANGQFHDVLASMVPAPGQWVLEHGYLGVAIFFVISGFVISYSVLDHAITGKFILLFAVRRSLRLDPPYWLVIGLIIALNFLSNFVLTDRTAPLPGLGEVAVNMFYLQGILSGPGILGVAWTLVLEVQFYLAYVVSLGVAGWLALNVLRRRPQQRWGSFIVFPLWGVSIFFLATRTASHVPFLDYWYAFFLGVLSCWALLGLSSSRWWLGAMVITLGASIAAAQVEPFVVLITAGLIYVCGRLGKFTVWLNTRWLQYLGAISYSVYLIHTVVGERVQNLGYRATGDSWQSALLWFVLACASSIAAAHLLRQYVELPGISLGKRVKQRFAPPAQEDESAGPGASRGHRMAAAH